MQHAEKTVNAASVPVATLAHDLLQPLRAIIVNVQQIQRSGEPLSDTTKTRLAAVLSSAREQEAVIAGVVEHESALETEWTGDPHTPLSLSIQAACLKLDAFRKMQDGRINVAAPIPFAEVPQSIAKVLEKVIHNSLKFREPDIAPIVGVEAWEEQPAAIAIRVSDNGLGVEGKYRQLVFQPFARLNSKGLFPGAGMGLATCLRLMQSIGGTIAFEDPVTASGSSVVIRFPTVED